MSRNSQLEKRARSERRIKRVRSKIAGTTARPRLAVFRSLAHISAQVIDDTKRVTIASAHDRDITDGKGLKKAELAARVGKLVAERAKAKGVDAVVFDRRDKTYHGRVRALAEAAREAGLTF